MHKIVSRSALNGSQTADRSMPRNVSPSVNIFEKIWSINILIKT